MKKADKPETLPTVPVTPEIVDPVEDRRFEFVIECMGRCWRRAFIIKAVMKKFNVSMASAYRDYNKAEDELADFVKERKDKLRGRSVNQMDNIVREARRRKEFGSAISAAKHRDELLGLVSSKVEFEPIQHHHEHTLNLPEKTIEAINTWARATARSRANRGRT